MAHNEEHNALVRAALERLAIEGYCAWPNQTGAWFDKKTDRAHKYGKKGSGDIYCILPPTGRHCEFEAKTGEGKQSRNQKLHQKHVVERNGGLYIVFRGVPELLKILTTYRGASQNG